MTERILADGESSSARRRGRRPRRRAHLRATRGSRRVGDRLHQLPREPRARAARRPSCCARRASTGAISLSHQVTGQYREYERTSTPSIDAYVRPAVSAYLRAPRVGRWARTASTASAWSRARPAAAMRLREADERPFETVMSGPVAGAVGTGACAGARDRPRDHRRRRRHELRHLPARRRRARSQVRGRGRRHAAADPVGRRALGRRRRRLDRLRRDGGLLRVGPRSAGAGPGPGLLRPRRHASRRSPTPRSALGMLGPADAGQRPGARVDGARRGASSALAAKLGLDRRGRRRAASCAIAAPAWPARSAR